MSDSIDPIDPLISQPQAELEVPAGLSAGEKVDWLIESAVDHFNLNALVWSAYDSAGVLVPPPDDHVLDHLARANELVDEERALTTLPAGTVVVLAELPPCDVCRAAEARYDATIRVGDGEGGAFLCSDCYRDRGSGSLGATGDLYVMRLDEVSDPVRARFDVVATQRGKSPLRPGRR